MNGFAIIEIDDGLTVVELGAGQSAEEAAVRAGGVLIDPGPYRTYEEAIDAMEQLEEDSEEEHVV